MSKDVVQRMTRRGGPVDRARAVAAKLGARPYRLFLVWKKWSGDEVGDGREGKPVRFEVVPRPKLLGYSGMAKNPSAIGTIPTGLVRATEVPLWLSYAALKGREHPDRPGRVLEDVPSPEEFWLEVDTDDRDETTPPQRFRLSAEPERDETRAQWILVLERQGTADRAQR